MNACWQKQKRKWESNQIKFNRSLSIFYHEGHEGHEAKNLKYFAFIFVLFVVNRKSETDQRITRAHN